MTCPYPCPQLVRKHRMSLDGPWRFIFDEQRKFRQSSDITEWPLDVIADITRMSSSHIHGGV
ncbi:MAG: hypothetical protein M8364_04460 [Methylobacter sp.]|uniref:hypothetical protein n=1 Tax=Methylobacter sp. TaxID=2051955 RepID=UPI002589F61B|nr:hypothetical protein [Methylobacter sp.]MCL7420139.1 hypothetical protein [Methylobacter sp.]